jgi:small-conductance mechanosensitive channel
LLLQRIARFYFDQIKRKRIKIKGFYPDWADTTFRIVKFFILILTVIFIYPNIPGAQSAIFQAISVFIGVLVSIGSTSVVANIVAGVALTYTRAFNIGDRVRIGEHMGDILEKSALSIHMRTVKNEDITIPNISIVNNPVINYSSSSRDAALILPATVLLHNAIPWETVYALLEEAAKKTPDVLSDPAPFVLHKALNDDSIFYEINAFTRNPEKISATYSELYKNITETLRGAGIDMNNPQQVTLR